jgi:hypothetical protein
MVLTVLVICWKYGKKHDVYKNPRTGAEERVPRHNDVNEILAMEVL